MPPEAVVILAVASAALAFMAVFGEAPSSRRRLVGSGAVGLAGSAAIVSAPTFDLALLVVLALGVLQAAIAGSRPFAVRLRPIAVAVALVGLALLLARAPGPELLDRFAAVGLGAGLAAAIGLLPYLHVFDPGEEVASSPFVWLGFIGPALAISFVARTQGLLAGDAWAAFGAILIGVGVLNMAWGAIAAWRASDVAAAWRYSFVADWGLALVGFGLTVQDGQRGALLILFGILLCRLPLYLVWRVATPEKPSTDRPVNLVVAAALAGAAPFVGFAGRILLLRGATQLYWPLALALAVGMLLWLPGSLRLGRSVGLPRRRQALAVGLVLVVNAAAGLYPLPLLGAANL